LLLLLLLLLLLPPPPPPPLNVRMLASLKPWNASSLSSELLRNFASDDAALV
jgi:hypothetical protein